LGKWKKRGIVVKILIKEVEVRGIETKFIETGRVENGSIFHLNFHLERIKRTLFYHSPTPVEDWGRVKKRFREIGGEVPGRGIWRFRVTYGRAVEKVEFFPITPRKFRKFVVVELDIDYPFKFADRRELEELKMEFPCGDEVIVVKNGVVTDTTISNLAFWDGEKWQTPATPLLEGTTLTRLTQKGILHPTSIYPEELHTFPAIALLNGVLGFHPVSRPFFIFKS
jgi:4-amino-4-deoxychorismate lyase